MGIPLIRTEADSEWALADVDRYFGHEPEYGAREADRFDVVSSLTEAHKPKAWPIKAPYAVDIVMTVMADRLIPHEKLTPVSGSRSRLPEFVNRKRGLTIAVANRLHDQLQSPVSVSIRPYAMAPRAASGRKREKIRAGGAGA